MTENNKHSTQQKPSQQAEQTQGTLQPGSSQQPVRAPEKSRSIWMPIVIVLLIIAGLIIALPYLLLLACMVMF